MKLGKSVAIPNLKTTPVSGISDEAYMTSGNLSYGATLSVHRGGIAYTITLRGYPDVPTLEGKEEALGEARELIASLGRSSWSCCHGSSLLGNACCLMQ